MRRVLKRVLASAGLIGLALAGCSPGPVIDRVPEAIGGLPAGAPARPSNPYQYPAVHDIPPARVNAPLSEEDQVSLEKELATTRDRQAAETQDGQDAPAATKPAAKPVPKPQRAAPKSGVNAGAKPNP